MTTLVRWTPFREFELMERNVRRVLEGIGFGPLLLPAVDVYETADEFVVEVEVPGFKEPELSIEVTDHVLTVTGERTAATTEADKTFRLHERLESEFARRFELPPEVDTTKLTAVFTDGVLAIHAPKAKELTPKKIPIET
jgi:HSP20 family protein